MNKHKMYSAEQLEVISAPREEKTVVVATAASGKALRNGSKVYTENGEKNIEDLTVGEEIFGRDGRLHKVTGVYPQGPKRVFRVIFGDSSVVECCEDHLWTFQTQKDWGVWQTKTLKEISSIGTMTQEEGRTYYNIFVPGTQPVHFKEKETSADPFSLGVALGIFLDKLLEPDVRIPSEYKLNSVEQRIRLLEGIMVGASGDSSPNKVQCSLETRARGLAQDIQFLCHSLGVGVTVTKVVSGALYINFSLKDLESSWTGEPAWRVVAGIIPTYDYDEMTCISIDSPDNLFLTNDFVVTHNTHTAIGRVNFLLSQGVSPKKMALLTFTNNAGSEMALRLDPEKRAGIFVGTLHSYVNSLLLNGGVDTSRILREEEFDKLFDLLEENPHLYPKMEYLVIDESQDLDEKQFSFIESVDTRGFLVVGDDRQSIYGFAGASPDKLLSLARRDDVVIRELTRNYRNAKTILEYSNRIASRMQTSSSKIPQGMVSEEGLIRAIGDYDIYDLIRYTPSDRWSDWAILCRTNKRVYSIMAMLRRNGIPVSTFKQAQGSLDDLGKRMGENTVKVLTIHSCVVGDTLVHTSNGIKRIEDVVERKDHDELVHDGLTYSKVKKFIDNGLAPVKLITTEMGNTIRVTDEHEVIVQTKNGRVKKRAEELEVGEELVLRQKFSYQGVDTLNEDLCLLAGMILRTGSLQGEHLHFMSTDKYDCIRFISAFQQLGGGDFDLERGDQVYTVECHLTDTTILDALGVIDPLARKTPKSILEGSQVSHRHFLWGFFGDSRPQPILKDEPLKEELQTILSALGVAYEFEEGGENLLLLAPKEELAENLPDFRAERVKMIEQLGEEPTYCLEMEGEAQFLQNGFLMGNSKGLEFEKVILADKISRGEENQRLFYVAVTRAERELYMVL